MVCACCCHQEDRKESDMAEKQAIENFLNDQETLDKLWTAFDTNKDNMIDRKEFENLVLKSLLKLYEITKPGLPLPSMKEIQPFVKEVTKILRPHIDKNKDKQISKEEFKGWGEYLTSEFNKMTKELEAKKKKDTIVMQTDNKMMQPEDPAGENTADENAADDDAADENTKLLPPDDDIKPDTMEE